MTAGYRVRCLLPDERLDKVTWQTPPEIMTGTLTDEEILYRAVTGVHTVIHLESAQWWGAERDLERIEIAGTRSLLEAARSARVGRVVMLSHIGAASSAAYPLMRVKGQVEEIVRASGMAYTIIRPGLVFGQDDAFFNHIAMMLAVNPLFVLMPGRGEVVLHPIYIDDLVEVVLQTLENLNTVDQSIEIGGPEYITLQDLMRTIMRVSGRYRLVIPVPPYLLRWINRATRTFLPRTLLTPQWLDILATNRAAQLGTLARYFDVRLHRLEDTMLTYMHNQNGLFAALRYGVRRRPRRH